jgi:hypothetical protein
MRLFALLLVCVCGPVLSGCGGGGFSVSGVPKAKAPVPPTQGNWYLAAISSTLAGPVGGLITNYSGPLAVSGGSVSVTTTGNDSCFSANTPLVLSGPNSGSNITLSSPQSTLSGFTLTITGNVTNGTSMDGTYQLAGSTDTKSCRADIGTVYGTSVPVFNGTWTGTVNENQYPSGGLNGLAPTGYVPNAAGMSINTTQATTAATFPNPGGGTIMAYPVSGSITWTNANCYGSGTIDPTQSYILGNIVNLTVINAAGGYPSYSVGTILAQPSSPLLTFPVLLSPVGGPCDQYTVSGNLTAAQ